MMIYGIGVDTVCIDRFDQWVHYPISQLEKIFTHQELDDCKDLNGVLIAEKLASRFAVKEAFYKALSSALVTLHCNKKMFSLISLCTKASLTYGEWGVPTLVIDWKAIEGLCGSLLPPLNTHVSIAHEKTVAIAFVILEQQ